jgi:hypothetical protein
LGESLKPSLFAGVAYKFYGEAVIPAKAGIQSKMRSILPLFNGYRRFFWIPAFAGMTKNVVFR